MITGFAIMTASALSQATAASPQKLAQDLAFHCYLYDFEATAAGKASANREVAVLSSFDNGSGAVLETYDPAGLLIGNGLATLKLAADPRNDKSYIFILKSAADSRRPTMLTVAPDEEPISATQKGDFIGVLGFEDQPNPTHVGKCSIAKGEAAIALFKAFHGRERIKR